MDGWVGAWTGGRAAVHVGNVADFNEQFFAPDMDAAQRARRLRQAHHYACLTTCYSPEPALLVLPAEVGPEWTDWLARELEWGPVEVHGGVGGAGGGRPGGGRRPRPGGRGGAAA
ncbi:hypothetical protein, partial [Kitasatospora sp. NPDC059800]|uniref:hypothetical protein n=1 Tax=Kitasatospora sp. NPDC059800 TaxID=3346951 RepID=UPI00365BD5E5